MMKPSRSDVSCLASPIAPVIRPSVRKTRPARLAKIMPQAHPVVTTPSGKKIDLQAVVTIGTSDTCDIQVPETDGTVAAMHAELFCRGPRVYCRALAGDQESLKSRSHSWLFETELRPGVDYMLSPASELTFGSLGENMVLVDFDQGSGELGGMAQMMMGAMAQGASKEVRDRFSK